MSTSFLALWLCLQANPQAGQMNFQEVAKHIGPIGWTVMALLFLMSVWSFGVMLDRAFLYSAARRQSRRFVQQVAGALREGRLDEAIQITERNSKSHIAKVTASGLVEFQLATARDPAKAMEGIQRTLDRSAAIVHAEFERGLSSLATIGATAPFVGLFGTVVGILTAFKKISDTGATGLPSVAGGISEALIATALGLLVAIPAVWAFNAFTNRLKFYGVEMDNSSMELVNYFLARMDEKRPA